MRKEGRLMPDTLLWRAISDGARRFPEEYELAVAFLEGGSAYYVADHVRAKKKAAFIHIDYQKAGYSRELDRDCYLQYDAVFPIGEQVKRAFLAVYPECRARTRLYHHRIDCEKSRKMSRQDVYKRQMKSRPAWTSTSRVKCWSMPQRCWQS